MSEEIRKNKQVYIPLVSKYFRVIVEEITILEQAKVIQEGPMRRFQGEIVNTHRILEQEVPAINLLELQKLLSHCCKPMYLFDPNDPKSLPILIDNHR